MASSGQFGHPPSGELAARFAAERITWYYLAEVLVLGTPLSPMDSARQAAEVWRGSAPHWNLLSSPDFNYVALGAARGADGWWYWCGLLIKGPDRTAPTARVARATMDAISSGRRNVTVSWTGADVPLSVLTAGLRDFRLQRRVGTGVWRTVVDWTPSTSRTFSLAVGRTYQFRVRARDWNGNKSTWSMSLTVTP